MTRSILYSWLTRKRIQRNSNVLNENVSLAVRDNGEEAIPRWRFVSNFQNEILKQQVLSFLGFWCMVGKLKETITHLLTTYMALIKDIVKNMFYQFISNKYNDYAVSHWIVRNKRYVVGKSLSGMLNSRQTCFKLILRRTLRIQHHHFSCGQSWP